MDIIFTNHALLRCNKRGMLKEEILDAVHHPDSTLKKNGKYYFQKRLERGMIEICSEKTEKHIKIITVYWL